MLNLGYFGPDLFPGNSCVAHPLTVFEKEGTALGGGRRCPGRAGRTQSEVLMEGNFWAGRQAWALD
jgi:hypothetical protein